MKAVVVDLEMNQPSNHIIQIGAVCVNVRARRWLSQFNQYVKLDGEEALSPFITELTGITKEMLENEGIPLPLALTNFCTWCAEQQVSMIISWGRDGEILRDAQNTARFHWPRLLDLKSTFMILRCGLPQGKAKGGLLRAIEQVGLQFKGQQHNALVDAQNTARLVVWMRELMAWNQMVTGFKVVLGDKES